MDVIGEQRKWDDLPIDCLAKIFDRAGTESLIFSLPLVCKNWHTASLDPRCWNVIDLSSPSKIQNDEFFEIICDVPLFRKLVKFAVDRSQGIATKVVVGYTCSEYENIMTYISEGCPLLKTLILYEANQAVAYQDEGMACIPKLIKKWKYLEHLSVTCDDYFEEILFEVSAHCKNFASLTTGKEISREAAMAIVNLLPTLKLLTLSESRLDRQNLITILAGCGELEFLDVTHCKGFDEHDEEILKLASHIKTCRCEGSWDFDIESYDYLRDEFPFEFEARYGYF